MNGPPALHTAFAQSLVDRVLVGDFGVASKAIWVCWRLLLLDVGSITPERVRRNKRFPRVHRLRGEQGHHSIVRSQLERRPERAGSSRERGGSGTVPTPAYDGLGLAREQMAGFLQTQTAATPAGRVGRPEVPRSMV